MLKTNSFLKIKNSNKEEKTQYYKFKKKIIDEAMHCEYYINSSKLEAFGKLLLLYASLI